MKSEHEERNAEHEQVNAVIKETKALTADLWSEIPAN